MRLLLDTNVILAALITRGVCHELLEHCEREHQIVSSERILEELARKLREKFHVPSEKVQEAVALLRGASEVVEPHPLPAAICRDPDDDWVLAAAVKGRCVCLLTGDKDLLVLKHYEGIPILSPGNFWSFEASLTRGA